MKKAIALTSILLVLLVWSYTRAAYDYEVVWDDSQQIASAIKDTGANVPTMTQYGATGVWYPAFGKGDSDLLPFNIQLPHSYKEGTDVNLHIHWMATGGGTGDVTWAVDYQWVNINGSFGSSTALTPVTIASADIVEDKHLMTAIATLDGHTAAKHVSSAICGKVTRTDNSRTGTVFLVFIDVHFQKDTHGSRTAGVK